MDEHTLTRTLGEVLKPIVMAAVNQVLDSGNLSLEPGERYFFDTCHDNLLGEFESQTKDEIILLNSSRIFGPHEYWSDFMASGDFELVGVCRFPGRTRLAKVDVGLIHDWPFQLPRKSKKAPKVYGDREGPEEEEND